MGDWPANQPTSPRKRNKARDFLGEVFYVRGYGHPDILLENERWLREYEYRFIESEVVLETAFVVSGLAAPLASCWKVVSSWDS
jgi:hypothetical protein